MHVFSPCETQIKVLQNLIDKTRPDQERISNELTSLFDAFQDLNLQLNERFNKSIEDLLKEFEEQSHDDPSIHTPQNNPQGKPPIVIVKDFN